MAGAHDVAPEGRSSSGAAADVISLHLPPSPRVHASDPAHQVAPLQRELASFLQLRGSAQTGTEEKAAGQGACLSATMITSKGQRIRAHNASVRDVKRDFRTSATAASVQNFFAKHQRLLDTLLQREHVRVD